MVLVATGASPRELPEAKPDGERILTWTQVYRLAELPEKLIVVGSGVTGAEFASAYHALGVEVVLVSSRDRVLPGEDADAAQVLEDVFARRGLTVLGRSRAQSVTRDGDDVTVTLTDGRTVSGSTACSPSARCPTPPTWASRRRGSRSTGAASSRSTGSPGPRPAGCMRQGTAPAC